MLEPLYHAVAWLVVHIHALLTPVFGRNSGAGWALSIVLLTMAMRLLLFPLFVKQIKTQRAMQVLQPKIKELQQKHKNDREKLNQELMALYREHNANPLSGCLPLLLQIPVFFALFHTLNSIKPKAAGDAALKGCPVEPGAAFGFPCHVAGFPGHLIQSAANAKIFGAPIAAAFDSKASLMKFLGADPTSVKITAVVLVVLMGITTFITQRQLMARTAASGQPNQFASQQKILLYVLPFTFFIFGFRFPLGVLIYWLTTNIWSMAQQHVVIGRMGAMGNPAVATAGGAPAPRLTPKADGSRKPPAAPKRGTPPKPAPPADGADGATNAAPPDTGNGSGASSPPSGPTRPATTPSGGARRPANRNRRRNRRGRR